LRTVRLRGTLSQGLILPLSTIPETWNDGVLCSVDDLYSEGEDVSELLGIIKYEPPIPACLAGEVKGLFPSFLRKTDQERCLLGDTLIDTDQGKYTIKEIVDGNLKLNVLSLNHTTNKLEFKPIIGWSKMAKRKGWVKITLKSGKTITCTNNHLIWCEDILAYRKANKIKVGQTFITKTE
jgi:hypothetical protein